MFASMIDSWTDSRKNKTTPSESKSFINGIGENQSFFEGYANHYINNTLPYRASIFKIAHDYKGD